MNCVVPSDMQKYHRQIILPEIGLEGQEKISRAKVLMIGAGGLGSPILQYLVGSGVGVVGIVDFDSVEVHNLPRQILYSPEDIGKSKVDVAVAKLQKQNPDCTIIAHSEVLYKKNCEQIIAQYDIVIDGTDNFATRYLINDTCVLLDKPLVYGSILGFEGQVAVFNYKGGKNLRDVFPESPEPQDTPSCNENGVLGVVPGIVGLFMAQACMQLILDTYTNNCLHMINCNTCSVISLQL